jgi:two-component system, NarL family, sensor histidine kinase FusK
VHFREPSLKEQGALFGLIPFLRRRYWIALCVVTALSAASTCGSPGFSVSAPRLALVWPSAGIGIAVILLLGPRATPALFAGSLAATIVAGMPFVTSLTIAFSIVLEALSGAYLLRNATDFRGDLARVNDILLFLLFGVGIASMIGATIGTVAICTGGVVPWSDAGRLWRIWWLGDAMGTLIVGSLLLAWTVRFERHWSLARFIEAVGLLAMLGLVVAVVHAGMFQPDLVAPLSFLAFPFVIWAALRFGLKGATVATSVAVAFALWGMLHGEGPFAEPRFAVGVVFFYGYTASIALTGLLLGAATTERRRSAEELQRIGQDLDIRVRERTADLQEELSRRRRAQEELQSALHNVKTLSGLLPICASCKKIRDDGGYWTQVERYLTEHTQAQFSHGLCPDCFAMLYPEYSDRNGSAGGTP